MEIEITSEMNVHHSTKHTKDKDVIAMIASEAGISDDHLFQENQIDRHRHGRANEHDHTREHHPRHLPFDGFAMRR